MRLPLRHLATAVGALLVGISLSACGSSEPRSLIDSIDRGTVLLGTKFDQPGLGLRHPDRSMSGVDVDVATYVVNRIAERRGKPHPTIAWRETPSPQRETLIRNGEIDIIVATYSINAKRDSIVDFAGPYLITEQALLVRADDAELSDMSGLRHGRKLCSVAGSTPAQNVKTQLPGVQLQQYDTYSSCVEALHQGKVDALTTDATILAGFAQQYPGEFRLVPMRLLSDLGSKKAGSAFSVEYYGIGHAENQPDVQEALDEALRTMVDSGEWDRIVERNLGGDLKADGVPLLCPGRPGDYARAPRPTCDTGGDRR